MKSTELQLTPTPAGATIAYGETPVIVELGVGIPVNGRWRWSFDGSLRLVSSSRESGPDQLGSSVALVLTYADDEGPMLRLRLKVYQVFLQPPYDCLIGPPGLGEKRCPIYGCGGHHPPGVAGHGSRGQLLSSTPPLTLR